MEQMDDPKIAFALLRPACVQLTREQTVENVQQLHQELKIVSDSALQQLQEYVLFPLRFVLKTPGPKKERLVQAVVECICFVLGSTCVRSWDVMRELFSELCCCLQSRADPGKPAPASEELRAAVLEGLILLLHAAYGDVVSELYKPAMLPGLGTAVSLLLALAEEEKCRKVQATALGCLQSLLLQCDCPQEHVPLTPEEELSLGTTFASFLPGITLALSRVVTGDIRQGQDVTVRAIRVWYKTVGLVMADDQLARSKVGESPVSSLGRVGELVVQRTPSWAEGTSGKLAVLLKKIISCALIHQHWKVRLELVRLSDHLLAKSHQSLKECLSPLLEALVAMVSDKNPIVQNECKAVLESVAHRNWDHGSRTFMDVLSENLHSLATTLPRLMRTTDDQHKLCVLSTFLGYLKILGPRITAVLNSAPHLQRISKAMMQVLELDVSDVRVLEERGSANPVEVGMGHHEMPTQKKKCFLYFRDENINSLLWEICQLLGHYGNLYLLVDHFMELYRESSAYRKQAAMVLNEVIAGAAGAGVAQEHSLVNQDDLRAVVKSVIEEYTSLSNWHLQTVHEEANERERGCFRQSVLPAFTDIAEGDLLQLHSQRKGSILHQLNSNIWQICIQLEGIGHMALALGSGFQLILITALYPVLEKAGDDTLLISQTAHSTMWDICQACGYGSLKELVDRNTDYILNDVSLNLQQLSLHPHSPRVLAIMFGLSDAGLLPLVRDVVGDVLMALDRSYDERAVVFCSVLHSLLMALLRWFPSIWGVQGKPPPPASREKYKHTDPLDVRQFLLDYRRHKELAEGIVGDEETVEETEVPLCDPQSEIEMDNFEEKKELPCHIAIAKEVMERCLHLLSDPSLHLRLKVLDVLELCILVLWAQEDELLPLAHRCWPALLQRLTNDNPLAILRAFKVLCTLGETCGDFLRKRVSKEVLPKVTKSLLKQAPVSAKAGPIYTHSLAYKLQLAVLQGLGSLCLWLDVVDADLDSVTEACLPYLSSRQPVKLQEACISVFQHLIQVDPDAVWFTLSELHCPGLYQPPHPDLGPMLLTGTAEPRTEYTDNVVKLLEEIS